MRRIVPGLALLVLVAPPARAASILYATAATPGRVDGFCVSERGHLASTPTVSVYTRGVQPRRLLVAKTTATLYVAEVDRVEAFRIGADGRLRRLGSTQVLARMSPRDLALSPDEKTLYVSQPGYDRVVAYRLDAEGLPFDPEGEPPRGVPSESVPTCIHGEVSAGYRDLALHGSLLYVTGVGSPRGRVDVFALGSDGSLPGTLDDCPVRSTSLEERPPATIPLSTRQRLSRPRAIVVNGDILYVEEHDASRITAFQLQPDGTFCDLQPTVTAPDGEEDCTAFPTLATPRCARRQAKKRREQCAFSATNPIAPYIGVVLRGDTLLAANFSGGRIDVYRLKPESQLPAPAPDVRLPKAPARSVHDVRMTPVRLLLSPAGDVLYVAAGELDRVRAFPLRENEKGRLRLLAPQETARQKGSFPNDVALFDGLEQCR